MDDGDVAAREDGRRVKGQSARVHLFACALMTACANPMFSPAGSPDASDPLACSGQQCVLKPGDAGGPLGPEAGAGTGPDASARPLLGDDAGASSTSSAAAPDDAGGAPGDGGSMTRADPALVGKYAIRMRYHGVDTAGLSKFAQEIIALGEIALDANNSKYLLTLTDWCQDHAINSTATGTIEARIGRAEAYPGRVYTLLVTGEQFSTSGPPVTVGYDPSAAPKTCPPGAQVPRQEGQVWLSGNCTCPKGDTDVAPTQQDDCRVTDSDQDGHPGFTVTWTGQLNGDNYFARRDLSQLALGKIDRGSRKHSAQYVQNHEHKQLNCSGTCTPPPEYRRCADTSVNTVSFEPLPDAPYDCSTLKADVAEGKLFSPEPLAVTQGC